VELREGSTIDVVVSSVEHFGLLVEFEGNQGVVLVTDIYWDGVEAQRKMFEEFKSGQKLRVKVLAVTPAQFSASIKDTHSESNPWRDPGIYAPGSLHRGVVRLIFDFRGALVKLENGVDVIVEKLDPQTVLRDRVDVIIETVDIDTHRIWGKQVSL
jgi:ribosomal protein S1